MKRLLSCYTSDFENMSAIDLKAAILSSEGRTILGETVVTAAPLIAGVTNAEMMASFGADLLVLNEFDVFTQYINGFEEDCPIARLKALTGRPIGINLEPVDDQVDVQDEKVTLSAGRLATAAAYEQAEKLGVDFILLTGNPSTGVSLGAIKASISVAKSHFSGLVFAGKMHGAGLGESIVNIPVLEEFVALGADGVLIPAVGTVPGVTEEDARHAVLAVKKRGGLVMSTIGTSQESADKDTIRAFALSNKRVGSDIHHIGDGGYGRMPEPENLMAYSIAIRGKRHTYFRMGQSVRR
ncbi:DUF7916 family protein [Streptococcus moroccensis]|uniref:DUF7916 domain-containing protein n=1 Tax=Streptococcus moroccensis TaxID=1451356 RepID=A0ABT9YP40_9STRE|nr:haloacid dehalogenase-like hydrolase [Streptococcus moroccensis]MDQ0221757.1 hypothetical protein [Streptococcus moroccensis]